MLIQGFNMQIVCWLKAFSPFSKRNRQGTSAPNGNISHKTGEISEMGHGMTTLPGQYPCIIGLSMHSVTFWRR